MKGSRRRLVLNLAMLGPGLLGVTTLTLACVHLRQVRTGLLCFVAWQGFWYTVRLVLVLAIRRREPALSRAQIVWFGLTAPLPVLYGIYLGRGRLSDWLERDNDGGDG